MVVLRCRLPLQAQDEPKTKSPERLTGMAETLVDPPLGGVAYRSREYQRRSKGFFLRFLQVRTGGPQGVRWKP
jgi:hypothetical protein